MCQAPDAHVLAVEPEAHVQPGHRCRSSSSSCGRSAMFGREIRLVRRLVPGKARIALDAEVVRLGVGEPWIDVDQPLAQLGHEQLERPAAQPGEVGLVGLEPGATLLGLQLEQELDRLVRKTVEPLDTRRRSRLRHAASVRSKHDVDLYVLVHGAWGGAHGWRKVRPLLQQAGHTVFTPSLTGLGERAHLATPRGQPQHAHPGRLQRDLVRRPDRHHPGRP